MKSNECTHTKGISEYDHWRCFMCGYILTDSSWGVAKNKWFESIEKAKLYKDNGHYSN